MDIKITRALALICVSSVLTATGVALSPTQTVNAVSANTMAKYA